MAGHSFNPQFLRYHIFLFAYFFIVNKLTDFKTHQTAFYQTCKQHAQKVMADFFLNTKCI